MPSVSNRRLRYPSVFAAGDRMRFRGLVGKLKIGQFYALNNSPCMHEFCSWYNGKYRIQFFQYDESFNISLPFCSVKSINFNIMIE